MRELLEELELHPEDLADIVTELEPDVASKLLSQVLPADEAAPIFERLEDHEQQELAVAMPAESVARIASEMEPDDRADLFSVLPPALGDHVFETLEKIDPEAAEEVREIEKYPDTAAGHLMTTKYVSVEPHTHGRERARGHQRFVRENPDSPVYNVYVMTENEKLIGLVSLRELVAADADGQHRRRRAHNVITVPPLMDQEEVARAMAKYDLAAMPVVDDKGVLLGMITIDDIVDVLTQEQTEDVQKIGGVEPLDVPYFQTSFVSFIKKRAGWLIILFFERVLHADRASPLRARHGGGRERAPLRAAAHLRGRQLRLAVLDARHPRPRDRRDQAAATGGASSCASSRWASCSDSSSP